MVNLSLTFQSILDKKQTLNFAFPDIFILQRTCGLPLSLLLLNISNYLVEVPTMFNVFCLRRNLLYLNYYFAFSGS